MGTAPTGDLTARARAELAAAAAAYDAASPHRPRPAGFTIGHRRLPIEALIDLADLPADELVTVSDGTDSYEAPAAAVRSAVADLLRP